MTDEHTPGPTCRGSFALGTACGHCDKCLEEKRRYQATSAARDQLNTPSSALREIRELRASRDKLLEALDRQAEAWNNALELDIIAEQHRTSATILRDEAHAAIAKARGQKDG